MKTVVGLFRTYRAASSAVTKLAGAGYTTDEIAVIGRECIAVKTRNKDEAADVATILQRNGAIDIQEHRKSRRQEKVSNTFAPQG